MSTTKETLHLLHGWITALFAAPPSEFDVPIQASSIVPYWTMPIEDSGDPNWVNISTVHSLTEEMVAGGQEDTAVYHIMLIARISQGADAEASRALAENWLDDAEQMIIEEVGKREKSVDWVDIRIAAVPTRDRDDRYFGQYRTSQFAVMIEKR